MALIILLLGKVKKSTQSMPHAILEHAAEKEVGDCLPYWNTNARSGHNGLAIFRLKYLWEIEYQNVAWNSVLWSSNNPKSNQYYLREKNCFLLKVSKNLHMSFAAMTHLKDYISAYCLLWKLSFCIFFVSTRIPLVTMIEWQFIFLLETLIMKHRNEKFKIKS